MITVVTAQNSHSWLGATFIDADFVAQQLDAVFTDYGADAVKTGFLGRVELIEVVARKLREHKIRNVVIDPVMVDGETEPMFGAEVTAAYRELLIPLATIVTPNKGEARLLLDRPLGEPVVWTQLQPQLKAVAPGGWLLLKAVAHGRQWGDWLLHQRQSKFYPQTLVDTPNLAGSGDTLSAALAATLALGADVPSAVKDAQTFTHQAIVEGATWRLARGRGPTANFVNFQKP